MKMVGGLDIRELKEKEQNQRKKENITEEEDQKTKKVITLGQVMKKL